MTAPHVLVSGATGFLGAAVLRELDGPVTALVRGADYEERAVSLRRRAASAQLGVIPGDVTSPHWGLDRSLASLSGSVAVVLNLAADTGWASPWSSLHDTNIVAARHAVDVAAALGAALVHVSTLYVGYDAADVVAERLLPEGPALSKYERSKCRGEWAVHDRATQLGVPTTIVRVGALSGDVDGEGRRASVPLPRLLRQTKSRWWLYARGSRLDISPRDLVARRVAGLCLGQPDDGVRVRHVGWGAAAPSIGAVLVELAGRIPSPERCTPVAVPREVLLRASALADRVGTSARAAGAIGLRYLASQTVFEADGFEREVSIDTLLRTLGVGLAPRPVSDPFYDGWDR